MSSRPKRKAARRAAQVAQHTLALEQFTAAMAKPDADGFSFRVVRPRSRTLTGVKVLMGGATLVEDAEVTFRGGFP